MNNIVDWNGTKIDLDQEAQISREFLDYIDPVQFCGHRASDIVIDATGVYCRKCQSGDTEV